MYGIRAMQLHRKLLTVARERQLQVHKPSIVFSSNSVDLEYQDLVCRVAASSLQKQESEERMRD